MSHKVITFFIIGLFIMSLSSTTINAGEGTKPTPKKNKTAIVLASFGTTVPTAVSSITNIQKQIKQAFPGVPVKITFTSNIIRSVWKKRRSEPQKWLDQGIPKEILYGKNIIATIGDLLEEGYKDIIVQPSHIFFMELSHEL